MATKIKTLLVDDHDIIRIGLRRILENEADIDIVGEATNDQEAIQKATEQDPDVILMNIFTLRTTGLDALLAIKEKFPGIRVLVLAVS